LGDNNDAGGNLDLNSHTLTVTGTTLDASSLALASTGTLTTTNTSGTTFTGTSGNDTIIGVSGADTIAGGAGTDSLTGGAGSDTFKGSATDLNGDTITDLAAGDKVRLTGITGLTTDNVRINNGTLEIDTDATDFNSIEVSITLSNTPNLGFSVADDNGDTQITFEAGNTAPAFTDLDGGTVAWSEGSAVILDSDATVSDTELDALNGSSGDWNSASLTVQRSGTAVTSDTFGFDTSGASFTVSGSDLQDGSNTFATFTDTDGVLTISFTGTDVATTALVNEVLQHITYQNDTPAGDAALEFTLNDSTVDSSVATVTVESDIIYVNDASDTSDADRNTISLREAAGIAAIQADP
jgi:hypothetical protein